VLKAKLTIKLVANATMVSQPLMQHVTNRQNNADVVLRVAVTQISYNLFQSIPHNLIVQYKYSGRQYAQ
jgi:hypothetical protein